ncbi:MAG: enoyl-CoA hydratase/isomerase family protein [Rhizobiales bacterium]|nr:enoyl-CoA hydratase/isomerase family protein [Hyphomicrobiales bacterium]
MRRIDSALTDKLRLEIDGPVARLIVDNAPRRNALDLAMWRAIPELIAAAQADEATRVVLLGPAPGLPFCSGADISEFSTVRATAEGGRAYEAANAAAFDSLAACRKPVIAAIRGFCLGGGMGLAAACDLRIGAAGATFGVPAGRLGVGYPPSSMAYVVAAVGAAGARDLFFTARRLDAGEAHRLGFLNRLVADEALDAAATELAQTIAAQAPLTLTAAKAAIARCAGLPSAPSERACEQLAQACFDSADYAEGRAAFLEKRTPRFAGR